MSKAKLNELVQLCDKFMSQVDMLYFEEYYPKIMNEVSRIMCKILMDTDRIRRERDMAELKDVYYWGSILLFKGLVLANLSAHDGTFLKKVKSHAAWSTSDYFMQVMNIHRKLDEVLQVPDELLKEWGLGSKEELRYHTKIYGRNASLLFSSKIKGFARHFEKFIKLRWGIDAEVLCNGICSIIDNLDNLELRVILSSQGSNQKIQLKDLEVSKLSKVKLPPELLEDLSTFKGKVDDPLLKAAIGIKYHWINPFVKIVTSSGKSTKIALNSIIVRDSVLTGIRSALEREYTKNPEWNNLKRDYVEIEIFKHFEKAMRNSAQLKKLQVFKNYTVSETASGTHERDLLLHITTTDNRVFLMPIEAKSTEPTYVGLYNEKLHLKNVNDILLSAERQLYENSVIAALKCNSEITIVERGSGLKFVINSSEVHKVIPIVLGVEPHYIGCHSSKSIYYCIDDILAITYLQNFNSESEELDSRFDFLKYLINYRHPAMTVSIKGWYDEYDILGAYIMGLEFTKIQCHSSLMSDYLSKNVLNPYSR